MDRRVFFYLFVPFCLLMLQTTSSGAAVSTVDCHCFRDRAFSAENPSAFDPYLLATVQNRLLAHAFSIPRKEIVSVKMSGARGETLWVMHWVAKASGRRAEEIQDLYAKRLSWESIVKQLSVDPESLGSGFFAALSGNDEGSLAWEVVAQVSGAFLESSEADYAALLEENASLKEAILACVLASMQRQKAVDVFALARQRGNWGGLLTSSGQSVESVEAFLANSFSSR